MLGFVLLRAESGEKDHVPEMACVGEKHHQAVDTDPEAPGGRQPVLERPQIVLVDGVGFVITGGSRCCLLPSAS